MTQKISKIRKREANIGFAAVYSFIAVYVTFSYWIYWECALGL